MGRPRLSSDEKRRRNTQQKAGWRARVGIRTRSTTTGEPAPDLSRIATVSARTRSPATDVPEASGPPPAPPLATRSPLAGSAAGPSRELVDDEPLLSYYASSNDNDDGSVCIPCLADNEDPIDHDITEPIQDPFGRRLLFPWTLHLLFLLVEFIMTLPRLIIRYCRIQQ
jgi:hypothetical protein